MSDTMRLEGFREMAENLRTFGARVARNSLRKAVSSGAAKVRDEARNIAPVDTGKLRRAIAMKRRSDTQGEMSATYSVYVRQARNGSVGDKKVVAYGKFDAYYASWVEFGTKKKAAQPFLRPSFDANKERAVQIIGETLNTGIQAEAAKRAGSR